MGTIKAWTVPLKDTYEAMRKTKEPKKWNNLVWTKPEYLVTYSSHGWH